jgi:hypothetical protein
MWFVEIHFGKAGSGRFYIKCAKHLRSEPGPYAFNIPLPLGAIPTGNWLLKCSSCR